MERKVIIASAKSNAAARTQFSGTTFGDLMADPIFAGIYGSGEGIEAIVKPGNVTLRGSDSVLPEGDFSVFLVTTKNKAGVDSIFDLADEISEEIENLQAELENKVVDEIEKASRDIIAKYKTEVAPQSTGDDELDTALQQARTL